MKKLISKLITTISIVFILWASISTIEVAIKNKAPNPTYCPLNLWVILVDIGGTK